MTIVIDLFPRFNDNRVGVAAAIDYSIGVMISIKWHVDGDVYVNVDGIKVDGWENDNDNDECSAAMESELLWL